MTGSVSDEEEDAQAVALDDEDEADVEVVGAWGLGLAAGASVFEPDGTALRPLRSVKLYMSSGM